MKYTLVVCLIAVTLTFVDVHRAAAQSPTLRKGVSVQMVTTAHATPFLAADEQDAWVVTVSADGSLYFDADAVTVDTLADWMRSHPRRRGTNLYIKADAHAQFESVKAALGSARSSGFDGAVLLTKQGAHSPRTMVPPQGIEVMLAAPVSGAIQVRLSGPAHGSAVNVNNRQLASSEVESELRGLVHDQGQFVQIEAEDSVSFGDVIRVIDEARAAGAIVALPIFHSL